MGKSTISMVIFNSYFDITRGYLVFGRYQGIKKSDQAESDLAQDRGIKIAGFLGELPGSYPPFVHIKIAGIYGCE